MTDASRVTLPASGMADEILANFVLQAQKEADRAAVAAVGEEARESFHLVTFDLGRELYGVCIESVQEIIRVSGVTPVPGAPAHVRGVINLRGRIIAVVDLRRRLGLPELEANEQQRIMVVDVADRRLGLLVDSVHQVMRVPAAMVEEIPEEAGSVEEKYLLGAGKLADRLVFILDLTRLLLGPK